VTAEGRASGAGAASPEVAREAAAPRGVVASAWLVCAGCGYRLPDGEPARLRCPNAAAGDDVDHVLCRRLDPAAVRFPRGDEPNPYVRYRTLFLAYHAARALGWSDAQYVDLVELLDEAVALVDGQGFRVTPFGRDAALSELLGFSKRGGVFVKDETGGVSGSHKARHLMGTLIELEIAGASRTAGRDRGSWPRHPLAIASCGNAALAAAVVARAAGRALEVFVPAHADTAVLDRLRALEARITTCERIPGVSGDPTYHRLLEAVAGGAVPFTCQGNLNGLAIEGGETLGFEIVSYLATAGQRLDRLVVQVGGGALASSCVRAFEDARELGVPVEMPRLHAVQTRGGYPLARAYRRLADTLLPPGGDAAATRGPEPPGSHAELPAPEAFPAGGAAVDRAARLREVLRTENGMTVLRDAARHRSWFMWPWEEEPHSMAGGILDDETYDWLAVVDGMLGSGGYPLVVDEPTIAEANEMARAATGIDVDPTGSSGLAGLLALVRDGAIRPDETVAVLFTGIRRELDSPPSSGRAPGSDPERSEGS
jgi:threonine synthase